MPHRAVRMSVLGLATCVSAAGFGGRQTPQSQPTFRTQTELVQVDVVVTDRSGNTIRGLTKGDFTVLDRRKLQTIAAFEEIAHDFTTAAPVERPRAHPVSRDVASNTSASASRLVVLVVDDMVTRDLLDPEKAIAKLVVDKLGDNASFALIFTSGVQPGLEMTNDAALLKRTIDTAGQKAPHFPQMGGSGVSHATLAERNRGETCGCHFDVGEQVARAFGSEALRRKAIVWVSPACGIDLVGAVEAMAPRPGVPCEVEAVQMVEHLRRASVAIYGIDPRGMQPFNLNQLAVPDITGTTGVGDDVLNAMMDVNTKRTRMFNPIVLSQENALTFAAATGGFAITNTDDFEGGLNRLVEDLDHYYLLGFYPDDANGSSLRPLEVTVNRPGLFVRYRRSYQPGGPAAPPKNANAAAALSAGVLPKNDLALRLYAAPLPTPGRPRELVAIEVTSPRAQLVAADGTLGDELAIALIAVDQGKEKVGSALTLKRQIALPASTADVVRYQLIEAIDLAPGTYQLRASVDSARLGKGGSVYVDTDVPNYSDAQVALGGMLVGRMGAADSGMTTIMAPGTLPFPPVLDRVFTPSDHLRLLCKLWRKDPQKRITGKAELLNDADLVVHAMDIAIAPRVAAGVDTNLNLAGLIPGPYRIRISVTDGKNHAMREIGIAIR